MKKLFLITTLCLFSSVSWSQECVEGDCQDGSGVYEWADGSRYISQFKNGTPYGEAKIIMANGDEYIGRWKNNRRNGQGTFTWANGDQYIGEWKDRKKHGKGTKTYTDGRVEKGIWKNDLFTGKKKDHNESKIKKHTKSDKQALTIEDELLKIKELYEKDLITEEVYKARQISILESYK